MVTASRSPVGAKVPVCAAPFAVVLHNADAAYLAGDALNFLDNLVRQDALSAGVLCVRGASAVLAGVSLVQRWLNPRQAVRQAGRG